MVSLTVGESDNELFERCRADPGDTRARDELVARHLPLARRLARRYAKAREPLDDLEQAAALGLVKAVDRFDPTRGVAFSSFAVPTILGELRRHFRDTTWTVRPSRNVQDRAIRVAQANDVLSARLGRSPSQAEIARHAGCDVEQAIEALGALRDYHALSLDADPERTDELPLGDRLGARDDRYEYVDSALSVAPALQRLSPRDREMIRLRFGHGLTQREIGERLGMSQMQVSRTLRSTLNRLHSWSTGSSPQPVAIGVR